MPAQPVWFHQLDEILQQLREVDAVYLDRRAIQVLFGIGERRARQLMAGIEGIYVGNAIAIERQALIQWLEEIRAGTACEVELARRAKLAEHLESMRENWKAKQVAIPAKADSRNKVVQNLAKGIELGEGQMRIRFQGAEDLAAKLFELAQTMANDWDSFVGAVEPVRGASRRGVPEDPPEPA